ncbi:hypothetical protein OSTOST_00315 [Ostertagia ostertagi]
MSFGVLISGEKYKTVILDACHDVKQSSAVKPSILCPANSFMKSGVIRSIAQVLGEHGVLAVNILCSRDNLANEEHVLSVFREHFATCFLLRYSAAQRLLACTQREGWSFGAQRTRFIQNLQDFDNQFNFRLSAIIPREN